MAGICREIGLVEMIDQQVGPNGRLASVGQATQDMVLNGLGFSSRALYLKPEFFANKPMAPLVGPVTTAAMLSVCKAQGVSVEGGFRFLKRLP